jgi:hypothetical protein
MTDQEIVDWLVKDSNERAIKLGRALAGYAQAVYELNRIGTKPALKEQDQEPIAWEASFRFPD